MTAKKLEYFGKVDDKGILKLYDRIGFSEDLKDFHDKEVRIIVELKQKRSNEQNKYFHAVCVPIVRNHLLDLGWREARSKEWVKDYIKFHCLIREYSNEDTGEVIKSLGKTSDLTTTEFKEFIDIIQQWASESLGLYIPDPGEQINLNL